MCQNVVEEKTLTEDTNNADVTLGEQVEGLDVTDSQEEPMDAKLEAEPSVEQDR